MPLLFWCENCSRPLTAEEGAGGDRVECPACHTRSAVPQDAVVIDSRKAARIRRRSEKPVTPLETDVAGAHTLPPLWGPGTRLAPPSPRTRNEEKTPFRLVERNDLLPVCPHCAAELPEIHVRTEGIGSSDRRDALYFCPHCRRVLGFGPGPTA